MIGLIILGLAAVVHSTKPSENPATFKSLLWIGASFVFVSIFGLFVNIILQFSRVKKNINKDKKLKEYNEKLALREEAFNKSRRERIGISNAEKEDNKKTKKH
jgi:phosphate/sulfate permease